MNSRGILFLATTPAKPYEAILSWSPPVTPLVQPKSLQSRYGVVPYSYH